MLIGFPENSGHATLKPARRSISGLPKNLT
jgi:hypothetical protein